MTTVGYGDLLPTTDVSKVFTALYVLYALVIGVFALSHVMNTAQAFARERIIHQIAESGEEEAGLFTHLGKKYQRRCRRARFLKALAIFALCVIISTVVFGATMDWDGRGDEGSPYVNGFYFSVVSLTTVGFGDIAPPATQPFHKFLTVLLMLFGIPIFGASLSTATEHLFGESREEVTLKIVRDGLNATKFERMKQFTKELSESGGGNDYDANVTPFEFLAFVLVANGIVDISVVTDAINNFRELDRDGNGSLTAEDLVKTANCRSSSGLGRGSSKASE